MIRSNLLKAIYDALNTHPYLSLEDFIVSEYTNKQNEPCLSIIYRYNNDFLFKFHIPNKKQEIKDSSWERYWFHTTMRPGRESIEESLNAEERNGLLDEVKDWLKRLYEDIVAAPIIRQFEAHASELGKLQERFNDLPDEPLSRDDINEFKDGLERVKKEFSDQLKNQFSDKEELKQKIDDLSRDIEFLKQTLNVMSKKQWGNLFFSRLQKWKNRFSLKQLATGTRMLKLILPQDLADEIESVSKVIDNVSEIVDSSTQT